MQSMNTIGVVVNMIALIPAGKVADKFKYKFSMPAITILKIIAIIIFT